jgi:uncharacterized Fe-S cluster-containing radical SAM superfamily protein
MASLEYMDVEERSANFRRRVIDVQNQRILIANFHGSEQEKDLSVGPNCEGFGRIRHFRRKASLNWVDDPLPIDPVCKALGLPHTDMQRAQVFQIAACNFRCWYCFVPSELLGANIEYSCWLNPSRLVDLYLNQQDPPRVIDLSGGQPDLAPEWIPWMMKELRNRELTQEIYLWSDDNLSTDYFWRFLSEEDQELVSTYQNYSRVCCFKGFDNESFAFNTHVDAVLFDQQFKLLERLLILGIDLYAYATFTTDSPNRIEGRMCSFIDRLQEIDKNLPLRTVPLEIRTFTPVQKRLNHTKEEALKNQYLAIEAWQKELENRYSSNERGQNIANVNLHGHHRR